MTDPPDLIPILVELTLLSTSLTTMDTRPDCIWTQGAMTDPPDLIPAATRHKS
ncbi:hypothetical protein L195_g064709, partial [Trifolium pratense]